MTARLPRWIDAKEAAGLLGVSLPTLYAYVSRGYVRSQPRPGTSRRRAYARDDVERLRRRASEHRRPDTAAAQALQWGLPVLESAITLVDGRSLSYRGHDATELARTRTLEEVAGLIWTGQLAIAEGPPSATVNRNSSVAPRRWPPALRHLPFVPRAQSMLAAAAVHDSKAFDLRPGNVVRIGARILQLLSAAARGEGTDAWRPPAREDVHTALARTWRTGEPGADVLRAALVLCADHELNVSSFTARCVASAGSHPYAAVVAALAALEGPRHGGASARAEAMMTALRRSRALREAMAERIRRGEPIEGFGHPLYRDGDPRAALLLDLLRERYGRTAEFRFVAACRDAASDVMEEHPNIDFALAAVSRVLQLPAGAPLVIFAVGRSVGWVGHAIEQYATGQVIRPRARYVGPAGAADPGAALRG